MITKRVRRTYQNQKNNHQRKKTLLFCLLFTFLTVSLVTSLLFIWMSVVILGVPQKTFVRLPAVSVPSTEEMGWVTEPIIQMSEFVGSRHSAYLKDPNTPIVSFYDDSLSLLRYAEYVGSQAGNCFSQSDWNCETVQQFSFSSSNGDSLPNALDYALVSIHINQFGKPIISYYDQVNGNLGFAEYVGDINDDGFRDGNCFPESNWNCETVDQTIKVGAESSLFLNKDNHPIISYDANGVLKYAEWIGDTNADGLGNGNCFSGSNWNCEIVDKNGLVGYDNTMILNKDKNPIISYRESSFNGRITNDLKFAAYHGNMLGNCFAGSNWDCEKIDVLYSSGTSMALDNNGNPVIVYTYPDYAESYLVIAEYIGDINGDGIPDGECPNAYPIATPSDFQCSAIDNNHGNGDSLFPSIVNMEGTLFISYENHTRDGQSTLQLAQYLGNSAENGTCTSTITPVVQGVAVPIQLVSQHWKCDQIESFKQTVDNTSRILSWKEGYPMITYLVVNYPPVDEFFLERKQGFKFAQFGPLPQPQVLSLRRRAPADPPPAPSNIRWQWSDNEVTLFWTNPRQNENIAQIEVLRDCNPVPGVISGTPYDVLVPGKEIFIDKNTNSCDFLRYVLRNVNTAGEYTNSNIILVIKFFGQLKNLLDKIGFQQ